MFVELSNVQTLENVSSNGNELLVLNFYNPGCGHCKAIEPFFNQTLPNTYKNTNFIAINVKKFQSLSNNYNISGTPTFVFLKNGKIIDHFSGASEEKLRNYIDKYSTPYLQRLRGVSDYHLYSKGFQGDNISSSRGRSQTTAFHGKNTSGRNGTNYNRMSSIPSNSSCDKELCPLNNDDDYIHPPFGNKGLDPRSPKARIYSSAYHNFGTKNISNRGYDAISQNYRDSVFEDEGYWYKDRKNKYYN